MAPMSVRSSVPPLSLVALVLLLLALLGACATRPPPGGLDRASRARIEPVIARMTVEEKVGQLRLYAPAAVGTVANAQGARQSEEEQLAQIRAGRVTGLFNNEGLEGKRRPQRAAVNESRLGIPLIFGADII